MQKPAVRRRERRPQFLDSRTVILLAAFFSGCPALWAQVSLPLPSASPDGVFLCNSDRFQHARQLSLVQRACWSGSELFSPGAAARAAFSSGIGYWRNAPYMKGQDADDYTQRFAAYYLRRASRETGELFAGYLNHEDPRPHASGETALGKRIRSALLSVVVIRGEEGDRPALAPIAGSLASSFAGVAFDRVHTSSRCAWQGAGISYSGYFGKALYQEFRPDIRFYLRRILHKTP